MEMWLDLYKLNLVKIRWPETLQWKVFHGRKGSGVDGDDKRWIIHQIEGVLGSRTP